MVISIYHTKNANKTMGKGSVTIYPDKYWKTSYKPSNADLVNYNLIYRKTQKTNIILE